MNHSQIDLAFLETLMEFSELPLTQGMLSIQDLARFQNF